MNTNRITLIGYVGKDLSGKQASNGSKRVALRVATHYKVRTSNQQEQLHTVWHDVIAWDRTADFAERSFVKGSRILVDGTLIYRSYPDKNGHTRYITQIRAKSLINLDR